MKEEYGRRGGKVEWKNEREEEDKVWGFFFFPYLAQLSPSLANFAIFFFFSDFPRGEEEKVVFGWREEEVKEPP